MTEMKEIRWHGRGGQGAVTAAKILAEAALREGKYIQAFPEYGPERTGAPVRSFTRISDAPIHTHAQVTNPHMVAVLDPTICDVVDVTEGLPNDGIIVINTRHSPQDMRKALGIKGCKIATVPATDIAIKELKRNIPNTPMIGALVRVSGLLKLNSVIEDFKTKYGKKFRPEIIEANVRAMKEAHESVKEE